MPAAPAPALTEFGDPIDSPASNYGATEFGDPIETAPQSTTLTEFGDPVEGSAESPVAANPRMVDFVNRVSADPELDPAWRDTVINAARESFEGAAGADPSLFERLKTNALQSFTEGTVAGSVMREARLNSSEQARSQLINQDLARIQRELDRRAGKLDPSALPEPSYNEFDYTTARLEAKLAEQKARLPALDASARRQRYQGLVEEAIQLGQYEGMPNAQGVAQKAAALTGQIAGSLPSPESLVGLPGAAAEANLARKALVGGAGAAVGSLATEPIVQAARADAMQQDKQFDWGQAGLGALAAFAGGGLLSAAPAVGRRILERIQARRTAAAEGKAAAEAAAAEVDRIVAEALAESTPDERTAYRTAMQRQIEQAAAVPDKLAPEYRANRAAQVEEALAGPQLARSEVVAAREAAADPAGALRAQVEAQVESADPTGYRRWWANALADAETTRQSPAGADGLRSELSAEQVAAAQEARLAARPARPADPAVLAMLQPGVRKPDPRLVDPAVRDPLGARYMPPVEMLVGQQGTVRPAWDAPATRPPEAMFTGPEVTNRRPAPKLPQEPTYGASAAPAQPLAPKLGAGGSTPPPAAIPVAATDRKDAARQLLALAKSLPAEARGEVVVTFADGGTARLPASADVVEAYARRLPGAPKGTDTVRRAASGKLGEMSRFAAPTAESARADLANFEEALGGPMDQGLLRAESEAQQALKAASAAYSSKRTEAAKRAWKKASAELGTAQKALWATEQARNRALAAPRAAMGNPAAKEAEVRAWLEARARQTELLGIKDKSYYAGALTKSDLSAVDKLKRGLARFALDSTDAGKLGFMSPAWRNLEILREKLAPQTFLPSALRDVLRIGEQNARGIMSAGAAAQADLRAAIRGLKDPAIISRQMSTVQDYLTGGALTNVDPAVRAQAARLRVFIDNLSDRAVREGAVSGAMSQTFTDNLGKYLRRSYLIHADPDYRPAPAVVKAAIDAIERTGMKRPEAAQLVNDLLDKNGRAASARFLVGSGKLGGKDVSSLIRRKDLLPEVRALLGEIQDPLENIGQTIPRLAKLIEHSAAQREMRAAGIKLGVFRDLKAEPLQDFEVGQWVPLVGKESTTHDVLADLHAHPEVRTAFNSLAASGKVDGLKGLLWDAWRTGSAWGKISKTVLNPDSYAPNLIGGIMAGAANGNFRVHELGQGLRLGMEEAGALRQLQASGLMAVNRTGLQEEVARLTALGLRGEGVSAADLVQTIDRSLISRLGTGAANYLSKVGGATGARVAEIAGAVSKVPFKIYGGTDDLTKYVAWKSEMARYARAFPQMSKAELERKAAEVVLDTMPTYSRVPSMLRTASQLGLAPTFVNFTAEVFRNSAHIVRIGTADLREGIKTGNKGLIRAGAERLAAFTAVLGIGSGLGYSKWSRSENNITEEQDAAVRRLGAPWNKNASLVYNSEVGADGKVQFSNKSYLIPHALLFEGVVAASLAKGPNEMWDALLSAYADQFLGIDNSLILNSAVIAAWGVDREGRRVINPESPTVLKDRVEYFYDKALAPAIVAKIERLNLAASGQLSETGRAYSVAEEMKRLAGMRAQTMDSNQAAEWKARDMGDRWRDATVLYRGKMRLNLTPEKLEWHYARSETARQKVFGDLVQLRDDARVLNVPEERVIASMRKAGLPADIILGVMDGAGYVPGERGEKDTPAEIIARLRQLPADRRAAELRTELAADPLLAKRLAERMREEASGVTEKDRLLLSLGVSDGERAAYIRRRIDGMQSKEEKKAYLLTLAKRGVATERVLGQVFSSQGSEK